MIPCDTNDCDTCGSESEAEVCPTSQRSCKHHCNHVWTHDACCWCQEDSDAGCNHQWEIGPSDWDELPEDVKGCATCLDCEKQEFVYQCSERAEGCTGNAIGSAEMCDACAAKLEESCWCDKCGCGEDCPACAADLESEDDAYSPNEDSCCPECGCSRVVSK